MRSKSVCKSWYALINSLVKNPEFVKKHLHNIDRRIFSSTSCLVFCCPRPGHCPDPDFESMYPVDLFSSLTIFHDDRLDERMHCVNEFFHIPISSSVPVMSDVVGCHCNGIILLADSDGTLMLCNPAIKEYRALPESFHSKHGLVTLGMGLGYDLRTNDYKVVNFGVYFSQPDGLENPRAEVYSLKTDSWREIGIHLQFNNLPTIDKAVLCRGVFYWSMWADYKHLIISFNMIDEVFCSIPLPALPDNLLLMRDEQIKLTVWNDSVALFFYPGEVGASFSVEVWVLDDCFGDVMGSYFWIKKLSIGPLDGIAKARTFWKNDELLLEAIDGGLISYNLRSQMLRNLEIEGVESICPCDISYVKSLVSVQGGNQAH